MRRVMLPGVAATSASRSPRYRLTVAPRFTPPTSKVKLVELVELVELVVLAPGPVIDLGSSMSVVGAAALVAIVTRSAGLAGPATSDVGYVHISDEERKRTEKFLDITGVGDGENG